MVSAVWRGVRLGGSLAIAVVVAGGGLIPIAVSGRVSAAADDWLAPGNPAVSAAVLPTNFEVPYSYNYNTDCDTRVFTPVIREAKPGQTELKHTASCAVQTPRGMTDGMYLDAGVPAGRFASTTGAPVTVAMIPNSNKLVQFYSNGITLESSLYSSVLPSYNATTGEVQYRLQLASPQTWADGAGNKYFFRGGSMGYSYNGSWMVAETTKGFVRINLVTDEIIPFAPALTYGAGFDPAPRVAISPSGRYAAIASGNTLFKLYDLATCAPVPAAVTGPVACQSRDVQPFMVGTFSGYKIGYYLRFAADDLLTFIAAHTDSSGAGVRSSVRMVPPGQTVERVNYLALGDSFSSGEGAYNYFIGTDEPENTCHLSQNAYPNVTAQKLGIAEFHNVACSGAKTAHYYKDPQYNNDPVNFTWLSGEDPQQRFVLNGKPSVVTVSMIGNDIGFNNKFTRCLAVTDSCFHFREDRQAIANEIHSKFDTLVNLYGNIKNEQKVERVYVLGYPQMFSTDVQCAANVFLDPEERELARNMTTYLNAVIKAATQKAGVLYVDVENAFAGKQHCDAGAKAVHGITHGNDRLVIANESFHPNQLGHQLMSDALLEQTQNFTASMPAAVSVTAPFTGSAPYSTLLGNAPSGGGLVSRSVYAALEGIELVYKAENVPLKVTDKIVQPLSVFNVEFHSTPTPAGTITANELGELSGDITVPATLEPGYHTLHLYGKDMANKDIDIYKTVYVAASSTDYDGDGTPNEAEKCLGVEPANADQDRDGVDDACDGTIDEAPADTTPPLVTGTPDRDSNTDGWYNADVSINWVATDPEPSSGPPTVPQPTIATQEGAHVYTSDEGCDPAGNCASGSLELKIDKTAPMAGAYVWSSNPKAISQTVTLTVPVTDGISGIRAGEYFLGDTDPGAGNGATMAVEDDAVSTTFGTDFPSGVYKVSVRVQDKAGNWSAPASDYLVVYNPDGPRMHGKRVIIPSLANGDVLPGLINSTQTDRAKFGFAVRYDRFGRISGNSDLQFSYETGTRCNRPDRAQNCHSLQLNATSMHWLVAFGENDSIGMFQGVGNMVVDGTTSQVIFRVTGRDGERVAPAVTDKFQIHIFAQGADPNTDAPVYKVNLTNIERGNIKIRF